MASSIPPVIDGKQVTRPSQLTPEQWGSICDSYYALKREVIARLPRLIRIEEEFVSMKDAMEAIGMRGIGMLIALGHSLDYATKEVKRWKDEAMQKESDKGKAT